MKITDIKLRQLTGTMEVDGPFMEERLAMPLDIYEEFRANGPPQDGSQIDDTHYRLTSVFVQIEPMKVLAEFQDQRYRAA